MESELDALTCWLHEIPANAWGGAEFWRAEWTAYYAGFSRVLVVAEPDPAGQRSAQKVALDLHGTLPEVDVQVVPFPEEHKDANGLHRSVGGDPITFQHELRALAADGVPASQIAAERASEEKAKRDEERKQDVTRAGDLLRDPSVFHKAINAVQSLGVAGEGRNIGIIRLTARSRALPRTINLENNSPSSSGKSHVIDMTFRLEDPMASYEMTASSERALIYSEEDLRHRIVRIMEPEGLPEGVGAAVMKSLAWDGRILYDTVVVVDGRPTGLRIEKEGPTGLIVATTRPLEEQLSNRLLRIEADASEAQTKRILLLLAREAEGQLEAVDLEPWRALSRVLSDPVDVAVDFASWIAAQIATATLRIRRDFTHLLTLVKASAIEHRFQRNIDPEGRVIATVADYAVVHSLAAQVFEDAQSEGITKADRDMIEAVAHLLREADTDGVSQAALYQHTGLAKSTVSHRVNRLLSLGHLTNLEHKKGAPHQLVS